MYKNCNQNCPVLLTFSDITDVIGTQWTTQESIHIRIGYDKKSPVWWNMISTLNTVTIYLCVVLHTLNLGTEEI